MCVCVLLLLGLHNRRQEAAARTRDRTGWTYSVNRTHTRAFVRAAAFLHTAHSRACRESTSPYGPAKTGGAEKATTTTTYYLTLPIEVLLVGNVLCVCVCYRDMHYLSALLLQSALLSFFSPRGPASVHERACYRLSRWPLCVSGLQFPYHHPPISDHHLSSLPRSPPPQVVNGITIEGELTDENDEGAAAIERPGRPKRLFEEREREV